MSKILIVDDESQYSEILQETLHNLGHDVECCENPIIALDKFKDQKIQFDLVLSDIKMPQMLGTDFFKQVKSMPEITSKFVLMTGHADILSVEKAYALGVDELLAKPFDHEVLELVINYLLDINQSNDDQNFYSIPIENFMISSRADFYLYFKNK